MFIEKLNLQIFNFLFLSMQHYVFIFMFDVKLFIMNKRIFYVNFYTYLNVAIFYQRYYCNIFVVLEKKSIITSDMTSRVLDSLNLILNVLGRFENRS